MKNNHGGKRKGAGRPKGTGRYGEETIPVRIPVSLLDKFREWLSNNLKKIS